MSGSLTTLAATVSSTGISAPTMDQILTSLQSSFQSIYGSDVYLGPDSQDGQWLGVLAQAIHDCNDAAIFVFNQFSPATSIGTGLSSVVKINGLIRETATNSTVLVTIVGQVGTVINNGIIGDNLGLGTQWSIPNGTTIPVSGTINVTATSTTVGNISVPNNSLTQILSPVPGWQTVTNGTNAVTLGVAVESDATLRQRQSVSTSIPAQTVLAAIQGGLANLPGVTAVQMYKNDTATTNSLTIPGNSICAVVEGGNSTSIANTIALYKTPGVNTYGSTTVVVYDSIGVPSTINFFILQQDTISVLVYINPLTNYTSIAATYIQESIAYFINSLSIGETSYCGRLWGPATLSGDAATNATGLNQSALDTISSTYSLNMPYAVLQNIGSMIIASAAPGSLSSLTVYSGGIGFFSINQIIFVPLNGGTYFQTQITNIVGSVLVISPSTPSSNNVTVGGSIYVASDLAIPFNYSAECASTNVTVVVL